jgi:hypothetical protein
MSRTSSSWLPLGSAHAIDWKHLGRPASARGATAWVTSLEGESVLARSWGEETTSYFDFVMLTDERVAGTIVVSCTRTEGNRLRLKTDVEIDGQLSYTDTADFRENARTLMLAKATRNFEVRRGGISEDDVPQIVAQAAELFEIAPDSAMQTSCAEWLLSIIAVGRDVVRGKESPIESIPAESKNGKKDAAQPRARTEHAVRPPATSRDTHDTPQPQAQQSPRRSSPSPEAAISRERGTPVEPLPAQRDRPDRSGERPAPSASSKLLCSTNTGESFEITSEETFIGRSKQCAIVLKSQRVSRKHACVTKEADGFYINDLGAANGIWAGSEKIDREKIETGDEFIVGDVVLSFTYA